MMANNRFWAGVSPAVVVLLMLAGGVFGDDSYRDFFVPAGWPILFDDDGAQRLYDGPPLDHLIVDAQVDHDDVSIWLFRQDAFSSEEHQVFPSIKVGSEILVTASSTEPQGTGGVIEFMNLLVKVSLSDLDPGDYHVTGQWYKDNVLAETSETNFRITVPEPATAMLGLVAGLIAIGASRPGRRR